MFLCFQFDDQYSSVICLETGLLFCLSAVRVRERQAAGGSYVNSDTGRKHNTLSLRCANARLEQAGHYNRKEKTCAPFLSDDYKVAFFYGGKKI